MACRAAMMVAVLAGASALASCAPLYTIEPRNSIVLWYVGDRQSVNARCRALMPESGPVHGCAMWNMKHGTCVIYTMPPNSGQDYETIRHELRHCQDGHFHQ